MGDIRTVVNWGRNPFSVPGDMHKGHCKRHLLIILITNLSKLKQLLDGQVNGIFTTLTMIVERLAAEWKLISKALPNPPLKAIEFNPIPTDVEGKPTEKNVTGAIDELKSLELLTRAGLRTASENLSIPEMSLVADRALRVVLDEVLFMQQRVESDRKLVLERKRMLDDLIDETVNQYQAAQQDMREDGKRIWKIKDVSKLKQRESNDPNYEGLFSERFQTPEGYQFRMRVFLNGTGQGKGTHISVFIQLCRTDYDDVLVYPFQGHCSITLYDQNTNPLRSKKEHYTVKFKSNNSSCFQKPSVEYNPENGVAEFVSHDFLGQHESAVPCDHNTPVYVSGDVIYIGVEIEYSINKISKFFSSAANKTPPILH